MEDESSKFHLVALVLQQQHSIASSRWGIKALLVDLNLALDRAREHIVGPPVNFPVTELRSD